MEVLGVSFSFSSPPTSSTDIKPPALFLSVYLRQSRGFISLYISSRFSSTSDGLSANPQKGGILRYLSNRFYDIETIVDITQKLKRWKMEKQNKHDVALHQRYGDDIGAALFVLKLKGSIRFQDQMDWYGENPKEKESIDLLDYHGKSLEAIDLSGSVISYLGLKNLVNLKALKHLNLTRCPFIDDWCLGLLHPFAGTLQSLSLAGCSRVTEKGLACLHHLENLQRLDVSNLPSVPHRLLIRILLEEMLPRCYIVGMDDSENTDFPTEQEKQRISWTPSKIST
ncbi:distal membrane-arm assembly complex protein 2 isoform X1 [Python bivittatus]|uniref:Distal membrane-arm assembly complex protein 2 n=1 Tax=Python bivittatus TaxID=176946 RepID=A0A9F5J3Y7_PYTBI|nr:distal membrane-arm assembly complex protein 2 isoform X1 [Python bivittatus]